MDKKLAELIKFSNTVGRNPSLVLGGFGNTSVKTEDGKYMYIKASGTALKDMTGRAGWRRLKVEPALAILKDKSIQALPAAEREAAVTDALLSACDDKFKSDTKPSIESCFHSILGKCVIHLHPAAVLAYACAGNGRAELEKLFENEKFPPLWVPYANPGYALAKKIEKLTRNYKNRYNRIPPIIFLQNHGLLITANTSNTALQLVRRAVKLCDSKLKPPKSARNTRYAIRDTQIIAEAASTIRKAYFQVTGRRTSVTHFMDGTIAEFIARKDAKKLCAGAAVTPDELVYAHGPAMWLDKCDRQKILHKLNRRIASGRELPAGFLIRPLGLFVVGKTQLLLVKDVITTYLRVRSFAVRLGGVCPLNKRQQDFIAKLKP